MFFCCLLTNLLSKDILLQYFDTVFSLHCWELNESIIRPTTLVSGNKEPIQPTTRYVILIMDWSFAFTLPFSEFHLAHTILLCTVYGHESHAVYRIRRSPPRRHEWRLAHHDQYGCGGHLLRYVSWPCNEPGPILGCITPPISREGNHPCMDLKRLPKFWCTASLGPSLGNSRGC